jgi:hypothetical protein
LNRIVGSAAGRLKGTVTVRSASLGWFSAPRLEGVEIRDADGRPVLEIESVRIGRSLVSLLFNMTDLGCVRLQKPRLSLALRQSGSNVEDVLESYLTSSRQGPPVSLRLEVVDGVVLLSGPTTEPTGRIDDLKLTLDVPASPNQLLAVEASGVAVADEQTGSLFLTLSMHKSDRRAGEAAQNELRIAADGVPAVAFGPLLHRLAVSADLAGRVWSQLRCEWGVSGTTGRVAAEGSLAAEDLTYAAPALGTDRVELERLQAAGRVVWQDGTFRVDSLRIQSDAGNASVSGSLHLGESLLEQSFELHGDVDLARLAEILPETLRIRQGVQVTSGRLEATLASRDGPNGTTWQAQIETSDLVAWDGGRQLVWRRPIRVSLSARDGPEGPVVEDLQCESDFLRIQAEGRPEQVTASATFDLGGMTGQLGRFIDLGEFRLAGGGRAHFRWHRPAGDDFRADVELRLNDFELADASRSADETDRLPWSEKQLVVTASATGRTDFTADSRIDTAAVAVDAGPDRLEARLMRPVLDIRDGGVWPVEVRSHGQLARWIDRLNLQLPWAEGDLAGLYDLTAEVTGSRTAAYVRHAKLTLRDFRIEGPDFSVREPQVGLVASGDWQQAERRVRFASVALTADGLTAQAENVHYALPAEGPAEVAVTVTWRGSLGQLQRWTVDPARPSQWHLLGTFSGRAEIGHSGGNTAVTLDSTIDDLNATHRSGRQFHQRQIRLTGRASYDHRDQSIQVEQADLVSEGLALRSAGRITLDAEPAVVQLTGQADYDMEKVTGLLASCFGVEIDLVGQGSGPVAWQGPLAMEATQATATAGWSAGEIYGFPVGPGNVEASLSGGWLHLSRLGVDLGEGSLQLASRLRLAPDPMELQVAPGSAARNVQINPKMCHRALMYVAPVLAGVATAEGSFSVELDRCRIPLSDPAQGELAGRMTVHAVRIGPGALVREMAVLLGRAVPAELARESVVSFQMVDGRIYHRDLELVFPDLTIRMHGSVGLDQTLAMVAEMPIPPKWHGNSRTLTTALRDQVIRVPIAGTLERPKIDRRALEQLSQQFIKNAARNVLEDRLQRELDRFLTPPR